jgi:hypothetical protein
MQPKSIVHFWDQLEDSRKAKGKRHEQLSLLVVVIWRGGAAKRHRSALCNG